MSQALIDAAGLNDLDRLLEVLSEDDVDVLAVDPDNKKTALDWACEHKNCEMVMQLLVRGAQVSQGVKLEFDGMWQFIRDHLRGSIMALPLDDRYFFSSQRDALRNWVLSCRCSMIPMHWLMQDGQNLKQAHQHLLAAARYVDALKPYFEGAAKQATGGASAKSKRKKLALPAMDLFKLSEWVHEMEDGAFRRPGAVQAWCALARCDLYTLQSDISGRNAVCVMPAKVFESIHERSSFKLADVNLPGFVPCGPLYAMMRDQFKFALRDIMQRDDTDMTEIHLNKDGTLGYDDKPIEVAEGGAVMVRRTDITLGSDAGTCGSAAVVVEDLGGAGTVCEYSADQSIDDEEQEPKPGEKPQNNKQNQEDASSCLIC